MRLKLFSLCVLTALSIYSVSAQKSNTKITITGTVLDANGSPVPNAIVMIDGQNTSSVTDSKGAYKVKINQKAQTIGIVTFGLGMKEEAIDGRTEIDFQFKGATANKPVNQEIPRGDEAVNTGYTNVKQKDLTTKVTKIDGTNKKYASYANIYDMISREVGGVRISGNNIIIQESKDFFGQVPALLIVDGVSVDNIGDIPPSTVESIEVLKGTSAAIYGSRGYGGVVLIKTKVKN